MNEPFKANYEKENSFIFPKVTEDKKEQIEAATKKVERAAKDFADALDSTKKGLTKELLDIFENLKKVGGVEETVLRGMSFKLLYLRNKNKMPEKLKDILEEMLVNLSKYEAVKQKSKSLEDLLRACAFISASPEDSNPKLSGRTFMPEGLSV